MPIYEYACTACGHRLEAMQKMSDVPLSDCPACEEPALQKLMSVAGVNVKAGRKELSTMCGAGACPACAID